jgi:uncharacterized protein YjbI with pentapeptide repeats
VKQNILKQCNQAGCRLPSIHNSELCWEHIENKEQYRRDLVENIAEGIEFTDASFIGTDLSGLNLSGMIASRANFTGSDLCNCNLTKANMQYSKLNRCLLNLTVFDYADLSGAELNNCDGSINANNANFKDSKARNINIIDGVLSNAVLTKADWRGARLINCSMENVMAQQWLAPWSDFTESDFNHSDFEFAVLGGSVMDGVVAKHVSFKRANLIGVSAQNADFNNSDFYYARLTSGIFENADFVNAKMTRAVLRTASFIGANMSGSKINRSVLDRARFRSFRPKVEEDDEN